jgi:hypothetical protein
MVQISTQEKGRLEEWEKWYEYRAQEPWGPVPVFPLPISVSLLAMLGLLLHPEDGGNRFL